MQDYEPDAAAIQAAQARLAPHINATPLIRSAGLDAVMGARIIIKPENLQVTGAFKFRGAMNRLLQLTPKERAGGVVTWSSGNHGLALSYGARLLGIPATVLMPLDAPLIKVDGVRANGATVRLYDKTRENREEIGRQIAADRRAVIVPPYDDPFVITGQATVGAELAHAVPGLEMVLLPCSGGGLASGVACGLHLTRPQTLVISVEPQGYDCVAQSLTAGTATAAPANRLSICDALLVPNPGKVTWPICQRHLAAGVTVTDDEVAAAMRFAFQVLKLVVEPGGAVALAAMLAGKVAVAGKTVAVVLSGGNVDPDKFAALIQTGQVYEGN